MHEQSETIQREDGKWINVYGRDTPKAGQLLPASAVFNTVEEAEKAARMRSDNSGWETIGSSKEDGWEDIGSSEAKVEDRSPSLARYSDKSFGERVLDVAGGLLEPAASLVTGIPAFVEGIGRKGYQYAKEALTTGITPDTEKRAAQAASETVIPHGYEPRTETGKLGMEGLDNIFQWIIKGGGRGVAGIEQIRRKLVGQEPLSQEDIDVISNVGSLGIEGLMAVGAVKGGVDLVRGVRRPKEEPKPKEEAGWETIDTTKYTQTEFQFMDERMSVRSPYDVLPETERARLEAELNPPVDPMRRGGQGELFTEERAYQPGEMVERYAEPPVRSARERPEPFETEDAATRTLFQLDETGRNVIDTGQSGPRLTQVGEMESRAGPPHEMMGGTPDAPIPYIPPEGPLPRPQLTYSRGKRQRGSVGVLEQERVRPIEERIHDAEGWIRQEENQLRMIEQQTERLNRGDPDFLNYLKQNQVSPIQALKNLTDSKKFYEDRLSDFKAELDLLKSTVAKPKAEVLPFRGPGGRQAGAIILERAARDPKPGITKSLDDALKMFEFDRRATPKQVLEDAGIKVQKNPDESAKLLKDIASNDLKAKSRFEKLIKQGMTNTMVDRAMAILTQDRGPIGKLIKWTVDHQNRITFESRVHKEELIKAAFEPWRKYKRTYNNELQEGLKIWQDAVGKAPLVRESFKTEKQWEMYKAVQDSLESQLARVNKEREASGMEPIQPITNYFPAMRAGDYWVKIFDSSGKELWAEAFTNKYAADFGYKRMKEEFKEFDVREPFMRPKGKYEISTFEAFEETLRSLDRKDPIRNAIQQRMVTLRQHRGYAKHGLKREFIGGAMGYEGGRVGLKNAEKAIEDYISQSESYVANLQKARLQSKLDGLPQWVRDKAPLGMEYIDQYMSKARGKDMSQEKFIDGLTEAITTSAGFGRQGFRAFAHETSAIASLFWLATVRFGLVQLPQHLLTLPKIDQLRGLGADIPNKVTAWYDGLKEAISPDAISKEARDWALKRGYLESTIVKLIEDRLSNLKDQKSSLIPEALRYGFGKLEQLAVRVPAFHIFEKNLRNTIADKERRFETAANMMDHYMVHYDRESAPMVYDKMGTLGEFARPLKQFAHNNYGQFFEYAQGLTNHGELKPLASFIGVQALTGGLKGLVGVAEATAAITLINAMFELDIPTPEQMLYKYLPKLGIKGNALEALVYGGYSTLLGRDLSSSLSAPAIPSLFSLPGAEFTWQGFRDVGNYLIKKLKGQARDADAMKAMMAVAPAQMRGWVEALYSEEGKPIPNPHADMKGNYPAPSDPFEQFVRFGLGLKTVTEAKWNAMVRATKQLLQLDAAQKMSGIDAIVDHVIKGEEVPEDLMEMYLANGGSISGLKRAIQQQTLGRELSWPEGVLSQRSVTPAQMHRLERMQEIMDEELEQMLDRNTQRQSGVADRHYELLQKHKQEVDKDAHKSLEERSVERQRLLRERDVQMSLVQDLVTEAKQRFPKDIDAQKAWVRKQMENETTSRKDFREMWKDYQEWNDNARNRRTSI